MMSTNRLVVPQKIELFITTVLRTSECTVVRVVGVHVEFDCNITQIIRNADL
jgi:hypothetical protein